MHARELKRGEAQSKEHVVSVEVSVRGEHSALSSASHPGRAVPLTGTAAALHGRKSAPHGSRDQGAKNRKGADRGTALAQEEEAGRESRRKGSQGGGWGEESRASTEEGFSGQRNSPLGRRRVSIGHKGSTERSKIPLSVIRNVLNQ